METISFRGDGDELLHVGIGTFDGDMAGLYIIVGGIQNFYLIYCISKAVKAVRNNKIVDVEWNVVG